MTLSKVEKSVKIMEFLTLWNLGEGSDKCLSEFIEFDPCLNI